jgi:hypothetical protein
MRMLPAADRSGWSLAKDQFQPYTNLTDVTLETDVNATMGRFGNDLTH